MRLNEVKGTIWPQHVKVPDRAVSYSGGVHRQGGDVLWDTHSRCQASQCPCLLPSARDLCTGCHRANKTSEEGWGHCRHRIREGLSEVVTFQGDVIKKSQSCENSKYNDSWWASTGPVCNSATARVGRARLHVGGCGFYFKNSRKPLEGFM